MRAVFFDMDGVLIDSENFYINGTYKWLKEKGFKGSFFDVCAILGTDMKKTYEILYKLLSKKYSIKEIEQMNTKYFNENPICYKDIVNLGVVDFLKFLKENNIKTALCSSSPKECVKNVLKECNMNKYFDVILSSDDVKKVKPDPYIYLKAKEILNIESKDIFVIEDSTLGIKAGKNAGFKVIAIKDEKFFQNQSMADFCFKNFFEIMAFFKNKLKDDFNEK